MINIRYKLISPMQIIEEFVDEIVDQDEIVVRPKYLSICKADQRYYQGTRDKSVLSKKLPLTLIHEAIGEVVYSKDPNFKVGSTVVMLPNIQDELSINKNVIKENYDVNSKFRGSSCDGFLQQNIVCKTNTVLTLPSDNISLVFLELMSVVFNALDSFNKTERKNMDSIAIYGDGSLAYIVSLVLHKMFPTTKTIVIGKRLEKLECFTFVDEKYTIDEIPSDLTYSHAFECVGGLGSEVAIDQIIEKIEPQGIACLLGVSEYSISINTRMILEKGLHLIGNSRSSAEDFKEAIKFIEKNPDVLTYLNILISDIVEINDVTDIDKAFMIDTTNCFKTVMEWNI